MWGCGTATEWPDLGGPNSRPSDVVHFSQYLERPLTEPNLQALESHITRRIAMPSAIHTQGADLSRWERPAKTKHELPWADVEVIDLSKFDEPGGKQKLAAQLRDAVCMLR